MRIYLETERMQLRDFEAEDQNLILDLDSDPEVMRFINGGEPSSSEQAQKTIESILAHQQRYDHRLGVYRAHLKESGEFMGWFHLRPAKNDLLNLKSLELGYRLKQKFWRKGYATEGSKALIDKAFTDLGAEEVWARTLKGNISSQNVMKKVGMSFLCDYLETEVHGPAEPAVRYHLMRDNFSFEKTPNPESNK
jgi:RimJ/RimL family protein N-acetyltransferase